MTPHPLAGTEEAHRLCDVYHLWPNADELIRISPDLSAINPSGPMPGSFYTKSDVYALASDPLHVKGQRETRMCLVKFLDGSPVAVRYEQWCIYYEQRCLYHKEYS